MTRVHVTTEGKILAPGSVKTHDHPVPVTMRMSADEPPVIIGLASNVTRDEDGKVFMDIETEEDITGLDVSLGAAATRANGLITEAVVFQIQVGQP